MILINRLINIGIDDTVDLYQKKETRLVNLFSLIVFSTVLICTVQLLFNDDIYPILLELALIGISVITIILNHKKKFNAALYTFVILTNVALLFINLRFETQLGNYLYYFPILFCTALLHNPKKPVSRTIILF